MDVISQISPAYLTRSRRIAFVLPALILAACAPNPASSPIASRPAHLPTLLNDPAEPVNRAVWSVNRIALEGIFQPASAAYRTVVPVKARESVTRFGHNAVFPSRLLNEVLQGRWKDAGNDTVRFVTNTTVGVAGLFDPATKWDVPRPRADFSQTFQGWGWKPRTYLMLPLFGPSDECNAVATAFDEAAEPWNYYRGARAVPFVVSGNKLSGTTEEAVRIVRTESDPYIFGQMAWSYLGRRDSPDWTPRGAPDMPTLETMGAAAIRLQDPEFGAFARTSWVRIPSTGKRLPYSKWIRKEPSPLVYLIPGVGSHRLDAIVLAVAEHLHSTGHSVVAVSSVFHPEFMEHASTAVIPGRLANDNADLVTAIAEIDKSLSRSDGKRITRRSLVGCSLGGYQALQIAAAPPVAGAPEFDRVIAINPPVNIPHAIHSIDSLHDAAASWPAAERQFRIDNSIHKIASLATSPPPAEAVPPFDATESKFLIGLNFRTILCDALYSIERRHHLGLVASSMNGFWRQDAYRELLGISFDDYARKVAIPYHGAKGVPASEFGFSGDLRNVSSSLASDRRVHVITNRNDFLLRPHDLTWLKSTFRGRLIVLPSGGHMGNIASPEVRSALRHLID